MVDGRKVMMAVCKDEEEEEGKDWGRSGGGEKKVVEEKWRSKIWLEVGRYGGRPERN